MRRTGRPDPRFNYELFNCNNFNIRYWSWNYRGCWPFFLDNRQTVINMARPSNPGSFRTEVDTFPRSTRMRQRLILRNSLSLRSGLEWCITHQASPEQGCLASALPRKTERTHLADVAYNASRLLSLASAALSRTCYKSTRLALQLFLVKGFKLYSFQLQDPKEPCISIYCHYLPVSGLGNLRACCLPWMW